MSDKSKKRSNNKSLVTNFIESKNEDKEKEEEPSNKKSKLSEDHNDSLKFFKTIQKYKKVPEPSSSKSYDLAKTKKTSKTTKSKKAKTTKAQPDIRKALSKHDLMIQDALDKSCQLDSVDPYEMQLALAISESLKDQQIPQQPSEPSTSSSSTENIQNKKGKLENPFKSGKIQSISTVLEKYGFKKRKVFTENELETMTKRSPKKRSKFKKYPTKLTITSQEDRDKLNAASAEYILESCFGDCQKLRDTAKPRKFKVFSHYLQDMIEHVDTIFNKHSVEAHSETMLLDFYVNELFEPSFVRPGHLLKNWNDIYGRIRSPERKMSPNRKSSPRNCSNEVNEADDQNSENKSCSDIFDGLDSFDVESPANQSPSKCEENFLEGHLDTINDKLSQTCEIEEIVSKPMKEGEDTHSLMIREKIESSQTKITETIDKIEIISISNDESSNSTIEYTLDDNFESKEKIENVSSKSIANEQINSMQHKSQKEESPVDLTQNDSDEEKVDLTQQMAESEDEIKSYLKDDMAKDNEGSSQNSQIYTSDEVIDISDDEINYSIQACNYEGQSECDDDVIEVDNAEEQTLMELMVEEAGDDLINVSASSVIDDINATVNSCMEEIQVNAKTHQLSSSIQEILNKYKNDSKMNLDEFEYDCNEPIDEECQPCGSKENMDVDEATEENTSSISAILRKYRDPNKENEKVLASQNFEIEPGDDDESDQETIEQNSRSVRKSLDNILNTSVTKSTKPSSKQKSLRKKSLGINPKDNDKYIIDTESDFIEPHYSSMTPVELKKELYKFGVRTLPVRKAIELLTHIYESTHPIIRVKASEEVDQNDSRIDMNYTDFVVNIGIQGTEDDFVFQLDENGILDGEEYILPKIKKTKTSTCLLPLHIAFYNMVRSNEKYQKFILEFRPLDLDEVYRHFRKFNLSYQLNDIIAFLDKRCITFKTKEQSYSKRHQKKKKGKASQEA